MTMTIIAPLIGFVWKQGVSPKCGGESQYFYLILPIKLP